MLKQRPAGFTLIELMVGLAVLAILLFFAMPGFQAFLENQKLRARAESVLSGLHAARQEAIHLNTDVTFMLTDTVPTQASAAGASANTQGPHWLVRGAVLDPASQTSTVTLLDAQVADETGGNAPSVIEADAAEVTFNPLGQADRALTISIKPRVGSCVAEGGNARCLNVTVSGRGQVRMCDPAVTSAGDTRRC